MEKVLYEVDPFNRLTARRSGRKSGVSRFREVLDGEFKVGADNELSYHVKAPASSADQAPRQIKLRGKWSLDKNYDLIYTLENEQGRVSGDRLAIKGEIIDAEKNALVFGLSTRRDDNRHSAYILKLEGRWQADERNRLSLCARTEDGTPDVLVLDGAWEIADTCQLVYRYRKTHGRRKDSRVQELVFRGYWDIRDTARISYVLDKTSGSLFDFKTSVGIFKENYIRYEAGIGISSRKKPVSRVITLSGAWRVRRGAGLEFTLERGAAEMPAITLSAYAKLGGREKVVFSISGIGGRDTGVELELSRAIPGISGSAFLRMLASSGEKAVFLGAGGRF